MLGLWILMLITTLLVPVIMISVGHSFSKSAPKEINDFFGYRTRCSKMNMDTWVFAHRVMGKLWKRTGIIMLPLTVILMLFSFSRDMGFIGIYGCVVLCIQAVVVVLMILPVEYALKHNFDDRGERINRDN